MFGIFENMTKAALNIATTPVALVVDIVKLPVTAVVDDNPFKNTTKRLSDANTCLNRALDPNKD